MNNKKYEKGSITLETTLVLPFFIFMFLLIFGFFSIISAQNQISHALVQSAKSLSLDPYYFSRVNSAGESDTKFWGSLGDAVLDIVSLKNDKHFTSKTDWYSSTEGSPSVAKDRFVGYLAGGSEAEAKTILKELGVINSLEGVKFSTSIAKDCTLTVTIDYKLKFVFDAFGMGTIPMSHSIKVKLWGAPAPKKPLSKSDYTLTDKRATDPGVAPNTEPHTDTLNTGLDPEALKDHGYTTIELSINFDAIRKYPATFNNPYIEVYSGGKLVGTKYYSENFGSTGWLGGTSWSNQTATFEFPVDDLAADGEITIVWKCDRILGSSGDGYILGTTIYTVDATK